MAYVQRDQHGKIIAVFDSPQADAQEYMLADTDEMQEFLLNSASTEDARIILSSSDVALIRVLEDLVNTLIDNKVILFTDLPLAAREKLANREKVRGHLSSLENLMNEDQGIL